jgi:ribokinase
VKPALLVVGSLNMDFVVRTPHLPAAGETVLGGDFRMIPGGKGANQACAAGRLASSSLVRMIGRVGYDPFADQLKATLAAANVDVSAIAATRTQSTGVALIWVDDQAQNSIVVAAGANFTFQAGDIEGSRTSFRGARFALFQLEIPIATVAAGLQLARSEGARTMLDPAPAQSLSGEIMASVDILTPNESEACILLGRPGTRVAVPDAPALARALLGMGCGAVALKLGDRGCCYVDSNTELYSPAFSVHSVDSTAAGDIFNAALAVALTEDMPIKSALRFANAAAAISVTRPGAQSSAPLRADVQSFLASVEA